MKHFFAFIVLVSVIVIIVIQAFMPAYWQHLAVDPRFYFDRVKYFSEHGTLRDIPFNEYQPGAVFFFMLLYPAVAAGISQQEYVTLFIYMNALIAMGIGVWIYRVKGSRHLLLYSLFLLAGGPIILFRFELFVGIVVILAVIYRQSLIGPLLLGAATAIKVYPLILLPFMYRLHLGRQAKNSVAFIVGLLGVIFSFMLVFRSSAAELLNQLFVHSNKPVNMESVQASLLQIGVYVQSNAFLAVEPRIVYGITKEALPYPEKFGHYLWLLPYGFMLYLFWFRKRFRFGFELAAAIIAVFLTVSSQLAPQYLYWFVLLIPFFQKIPRQLAVLVVLCLAATQLMYPLLYMEVIGNFWSNTFGLPIATLFCRNLLLVAISVLLIKHVYTLQVDKYPIIDPSARQST